MNCRQLHVRFFRPASFARLLGRLCLLAMVAASLTCLGGEDSWARFTRAQLEVRPAPRCVSHASAKLGATKSGRPVRLFVEVAETLDQRLLGLRGRSFLPRGRGMLFDFENEQTMSMWTRGVPLLLDMVYADASGRVFQVFGRCVPMSDISLHSRVPGRYVLVLPAGSADRWAIGPGSLLRRVAP